MAWSLKEMSTISQLFEHMILFRTHIYRADTVRLSCDEHSYPGGPYNFLSIHQRPMLRKLTSFSEDLFSVSLYSFS